MTKCINSLYNKYQNEICDTPLKSALELKIPPSTPPPSLHPSSVTIHCIPLHHRKSTKMCWNKSLSNYRVLYFLSVLMSIIVVYFIYNTYSQFILGLLCINLHIGMDYIAPFCSNY